MSICSWFAAMGQEQAVQHGDRRPVQDASSSSDEEEVSRNGVSLDKYRVEHHLTAGECKYIKHPDSTGRTTIFVRRCKCPRYDDREQRALAGDIAEMDGVEFHYSKKCKWTTMRNTEEFDHLVRTCKCKRRQRAPVGVAAQSANRVR